MTAISLTHLVANSIEAWGHVRPLVTFCARLVKMKTDLYVTLLTTTVMFERLIREAGRSFDEGDESSQRLRIVCVGPSADMVGDGLIGPMWKALAAEEDLICQQTGISCNALPAPTVAIIDLFALENTGVVRAFSGSSVKIYSWWPGLTYYGLYEFGDVHVGGLGNIRVRAEQESRQSGRPYHDVVKEIFFTKSGNLVRLPSLPPMYDYEIHPQDFDIPDEAIVKFFPKVNEVVAMTDGVILISFQSWEKEAIQATRDWMTETGRAVYTVGPLLPTASKRKAVANEKIQSPESACIQAFLDETLARSGGYSLLYISFGTIFFPSKTSEKLWAFLDVVMELDIPFLMSRASPRCVVPEEVKEKVKAYGKGLISAWIPQQMVLDHPATGWYVSHGGHNGLTEAIVSAVPLIMWPFVGDQPVNAVLVTDVHKVGYELLREVRSGSGLRKIFRTGYTPIGTIEAVKDEARDVLRRAFGEDGKEKRTRLQALQQAALGDWDEGGASRRDVTAFLASL
ncbi:UDP-Glycosyltransferase/glycogen phosphorylase [Epithele typhae]|uniref:UDP-Glycosyltransferase/glycogen phosphorylase n=1 Tax=Epithele typhae TaxID=378194 RepID=UPI002007B095|nr:UDP-Glycosyltransferase/glycogen phosphorylase [Epithele typhae]KAH9925921.1 UDP-Glycosyltransferase/glycogen phosphorylase [Epithele typhae]